MVTIPIDDALPVPSRLIADSCILLAICDFVNLELHVVRMWVCCPACCSASNMPEAIDPIHMPIYAHRVHYCYSCALPTICDLFMHVCMLCIGIMFTMALHDHDNVRPNQIAGISAISTRDVENAALFIRIQSQ